jgi:glycosyltransferase involved in cell wall biosynthesis
MKEEIKTIILVGNTSWSMIKFRLGLMQKLSEEGYKVYVIAPEDEYSSQIKDTGCIHIPIFIDNKGNNPITDLLLIYKLQKLYKEISPDLIFHYTIKPNIYGTFAAKLAQKRSIAVVTGLGYTFINHSMVSKIAKFLYKQAFKYSYQVWFINHEDRHLFLRESLIEEKKTALLPSEGVNTKKFYPHPSLTPKNKFTFVLIARLLWDKGIGEYVKAAKELRRKYQNVDFNLVGFLDAQNPKAISKEQVDFWVTKGYINYLGHSQDIRQILGESDCIVLPSYREGVSMILMEAAAMQKPIIASNVVGCKDLIINNISGFLCQPKNYQDLASKMEKMLHLSTTQRKKMGIEGRKLIRAYYDESIIVKHYLRIIKTVAPLRQKHAFKTSFLADEK